MCEMEPTWQSVPLLPFPTFHLIIKCKPTRQPLPINCCGDGEFNPHPSPVKWGIPWLAKYRPSGVLISFLPVLRFLRKIPGRGTRAKEGRGRRWGLTYRVGTRRLGTAGLLRDNDLVDGEDCAGSLGGELDGPVLGGKEVQDALLPGVEDAGAVIVLVRGVSRYILPSFAGWEIEVGGEKEAGIHQCRHPCPSHHSCDVLHITG